MEQLARPGGLFAIFKIIQYIPYIAIGLLVAMIAFWVIFGIKKLRWAKILAIVLTVLVVITGLLSFAPYIMGAITGRQVPFRGFPGGGDFNPGDREQFRDYRDREQDGQGKNKSGLDTDIYEPSVDFENMVVAV